MIPRINPRIGIWSPLEKKFVLKDPPWDGGLPWYAEREACSPCHFTVQSWFFQGSLCSLKSDDTLLGSRFVPVRFRSQVETCIQAKKKKKRMVYLEGPGMQRFVLSLGFILKFCRKGCITVLGKKKKKKERKLGMPIKTHRKNIPEAQQMLFCYCMFYVDGSGVLKNTCLWFVLFSCPRFSSGLVRKDLPHVRETALPLVPRQAELTGESLPLIL